MTSAKTMLAAACLALLGGPCTAQTPADIDRAQAALLATWERTPLAVRRTLFVTERPKLFGAYTERPNATFKLGEPLQTYIEPIGYRWTSGLDGYRFGLVVDFVIKDRDGRILGGRDGFLTLSEASRSKVTELMVNISLDVTGAPPGDYVVEYRLHDQTNGATATTRQDFRLER